MKSSCSTTEVTVAAVELLLGRLNLKLKLKGKGCIPNNVFYRWHVSGKVKY